MWIWPKRWRLSAQPGYQSKSLRQIVAGWRHPLRGLKVAFLAEGSFRAELYGLALTIGLGIWRGFSFMNWALVLLAFALTLSAELSNSTQEMNQRLANPRRYVSRRVRVEPPTPRWLLRRWQGARRRLHLEQGKGRPAEEVREEFTIERVPDDDEAVRDIYDVAAAQVTFPLLVTVVLVVHAVIWPQ